MAALGAGLEAVFLANSYLGVCFPTEVMTHTQSGLLRLPLSTLVLYLPLKCNLPPGQKQQQFNNLASLPGPKVWGQKGAVLPG